MAVLKKNNFDCGQPDGTTVTAANSGGGTGNDAIPSGVGNPKYDSTHAHSGTQSMSPMTGAQNRCTYNGLSVTTLYGRFYLYLGAAWTGGGVRICQVDGATTSNLHRMSLKGTSGEITISIAGTNTSTGPAAVPGGQWVRVEYKATVDGTNAALEVKVWNSPESTGAADYTLNSTAASTDTSIAATSIGSGSSAAAQYWMDDWALDDAAYPGPLVTAISLDLGSIPSPAALHGLSFSRSTALALGHIASPAALHGLGLVRTRQLALGSIPSPAALHGLTVGRSVAVALGSIPSPAAVHGLALARTTPLAIGHIASPKTIHGLALARTRRLLLGHIPSAAALHGLGILVGVPHIEPRFVVSCYNESATASLFLTQEQVDVSDEILEVEL